MANIVKVLEEFRKRGRSVVLENSTNIDYGNFVVKTATRFHKEETAREFFESEKRKRVKKGADNG